MDLALSLKIPPSVLSEIIHERRQADPSLRVRIAEALRADQTWLFSSIARIPALVRSESPSPVVRCAEGSKG